MKNQYSAFDSFPSIIILWWHLKTKLEKSACCLDLSMKERAQKIFYFNLKSIVPSLSLSLLCKPISHIIFRRQNLMLFEMQLFAQAVNVTPLHHHPGYCVHEKETFRDYISVILLKTLYSTFVWWGGGKINWVTKIREFLEYFAQSQTHTRMHTDEYWGTTLICLIYILLWEWRFRFSLLAVSGTDLSLYTRETYICLWRCSPRLCCRPELKKNQGYII